jgi:hypothetical protein
MIAFAVGLVIYAGLALGRVRAGSTARQAASAATETPTIAHE